MQTYAKLFSNIKLTLLMFGRLDESIYFFKNKYLKQNEIKKTLIKLKINFTVEK